jgi:peptidoglycan/xylan/chitin deacetylase (PgdA/CDA1 family)
MAEVNRTLPTLYVTFHGIGHPPDHVSAEERQYWIPQEKFCKFTQTAKDAALSAAVRIVATFDDGNFSDIAIAAPLLIESGLPAIFFPLVGRLGQPGYLFDKDIQALAGAGFEIGSHGIDHLPWKGLNWTDLNRELVESKATLEEILGTRINSAALPFGAYNRATLRAVRDCGYAVLYNSNPGLCVTNMPFRNRYSYRADRNWDIQAMARQLRSPIRRITSKIKILVDTF